MRVPDRPRRPRPDFLVDNAASLMLGRLYLGWGSKKHARRPRARPPRGDATRTTTQPRTATSAQASAQVTTQAAAASKQAPRARAAKKAAAASVKPARASPAAAAPQQPQPPTKRGRPRKSVEAKPLPPSPPPPAAMTMTAPDHVTAQRDPLAARAPQQRQPSKASKRGVAGAGKSNATAPPQQKPQPRVPASPRRVRLSVHLTSGRNIDVAVDDGASVDALRLAIAQAMPHGSGTAAPPSLLVHNGRALMPGGGVLRDLGVVDGAIVYAFPGQS